MRQGGAHALLGLLENDDLRPGGGQHRRQFGLAGPNDRQGMINAAPEGGAGLAGDAGHGRQPLEQLVRAKTATETSRQQQSHDSGHDQLP